MRVRERRRERKTKGENGTENMRLLTRQWKWKSKTRQVAQINVLSEHTQGHWSQEYILKLRLPMRDVRTSQV